jgi:arsenate reductase-like glutaredoxin family protein
MQNPALVHMMTLNALPRCAITALALLVTSLPARALYKVVQPDGSVTYTDRPPATTTARITTMGRGATAPAQADVSLPIDLRQAVQRYPVVLFTSADCTPCDNGRRLLVQRGVPYTERRIVSEEGLLQVSKAEFKKFLAERQVSLREFEFDMREKKILVDDKKGRLTTGWKSAISVDPAYLYWFKTEIPSDLFNESQ